MQKISKTKNKYKIKLIELENYFHGNNIWNIKRTLTNQDRKEKQFNWKWINNKSNSHNRESKRLKNKLKNKLNYKITYNIGDSNLIKMRSVHPSN